MRAVLTAPLLLMVVLYSSAASADQYRSEARGVSEGALKRSQAEFDAEAALATVSDPYARTMLLAQIAAQAESEGRTEEAFKRLQEAVGLNAVSDFAKDRLLKDAGLLAAKLGKDKDVIRLLASLKDMNDPAALRQLAAAYARADRWQEAGKTVSKLMDAPTPSNDDRLLDATVAANNRQWSRVLQRTSEVLESDPRLGQAWLLRIKAQLGLQRRETALVDRLAAWRLNALIDAEQRLALVAAFAEAGIPLAAASLMEEGMAAGQLESTPEQLDQLAALWLAAREYTDARQVLQRRLALAPSAEASLQLGQLALNDGDWDSAARNLRLGMGVDSAPRRGAVAMMLGQAEFQRGRLDAARAAFVRAATIDRYKNSANQWISYLDSGQASADAVAGAGVSQQAAVRQTAERLRGAGVRSSGAPKALGFTDVGAEASANADGRIPPFEGGLPRSSSAENPYADDVPLVVLDQSNMADWEPWLSDGHRALLRQNPQFRMPVYPSRRSVNYPVEIREATKKNRGRAKLLGSDAISGAKLGFPFPSPENGVEAMWNHRLRWRGEAVSRTTRQSVVRKDGSNNGTLVQYEESFSRYANISDPADLARENILLYYLTTFGKGTQQPDFTVLVHESANSLEKSRAIWVLPRTYKKMFRIPPVGYDNPFPGSEGLYYVDMVDMYNGAFDHYDWKLAGKRELLIGYNAFKAQEFGANDGPQGLLHAGAVNAEALRYEVHRVWVVEASERGGKSHIFGVRRFYLDEDSWNVVLVENYDRAGQLWRVQEGHLLPNLQLQSADSAPVVTYDLSDGRYFINRMVDDFEPGGPMDRNVGIRDYRPANVKNRFSR